MEKVKSTYLVRNLTRVLNEVISSGKAIGVEDGVDTVAVLTLEKPNYEVPPIRLNIERARAAWPEVMNTVAIQGARYAFRSKSQGIEVYLRRYNKYRVPLAKAWNDQVSEYRPKPTEGVTKMELLQAQEEAKHQIEQLKDDIAAVSQKLNLLFALINRNGDLLATPESGVKKKPDEDDLEHFPLD
jgi:hypothetical protein